MVSKDLFHFSAKSNSVLPTFTGYYEVFYAIIFKDINHFPGKDDFFLLKTLFHIWTDESDGILRFCRFWFWFPVAAGFCGHSFTGSSSVCLIRSCEFKLTAPVEELVDFPSHLS